MQALILVGKGLAVLFWLALGGALTQRLGSPFEQLLYALAAVLLVVRVLELWLLAKLQGERSASWLECLQVLLFGVFHLLGPRAAPQPRETLQVNIEETASA